MSKTIFFKYSSCLRRKFAPICADIPPWMEKESENHELVGGNNANSAIPWQVLISGTVYILGL